MYQVKSPIPDHLADELEAHFCESDEMVHWSIESIPGGHDFQLYGFFDNPEQADEAWYKLSRDFPDIPESKEGFQLPDRDWAEAYKDHFQPWSCNGLHWVPLWERDDYKVPGGEVALYLDPGMAFGTGNHPTTRLCVEGLLDFTADLDPQLRQEVNIVDAGCGSGILALSASLLGFSRISAFDIDADSIRICHENAIMNQLKGAVSFTECGLDDGLPSGKADLLLANILANVLTDYRESLLLALSDKPGSTLVLSGILQKEVETLTNAFRESAKSLNLKFEISRADLGQWSSVTFVRQVKPSV